MESNIQSLLDKIYIEGIEKSKSEAEKIISQARYEAESILSSARTEANRILEKSKLDSQRLRDSTNADLQSAKTQTINSLKVDISKLITKKTIEEPINEVSLDISFLKDLILKITENWILEEGKTGITPDQLEILIPEDKKSEFEKSLHSVISGKLDGMKITGSTIQSGFQIVRKDKGYRIDFTDESMKEFFRSYLRQKTAEWLFEE